MLNDDVQPAREDLTQAYEKPKFNESYAYFIERGREKGLDIVIAHFSDYDKGKIKAGWTFKDGVWRVTGDLPVEFVYDKFPIIDDYSKGVKRDLEEREIGIFNHPNLEKLLKDKHDSYLMFNDLIPFTIPFNKTIEDITLKTDIMQGMDLDADLDKNKVMLKPQYGFGGKALYTFLMMKEKQLYTNQEEFALLN